MSRLCVKNLPKYVSEDRLREFFSQKGEVTDAKLMRTKDGKSRQFAFVGFRTVQDAEEARKYFHNSYLDTCRLNCELARKVGDPTIPRPWSRYSKEKASKENPKEGAIAAAQIPSGLNSKGGNNDDGDDGDDPQLKEFLEIMQPRAQSKLWANDTTGAEGKADPGESKSSGKKKKQSAAPVVQVQVDDETDSEDEPDAQTTSMEQLDRPAARDDAVSDLDYFRSKIKKNWSDSETDDEDAGHKAEDSDIENESKNSDMQEEEGKGHTIKTDDDHNHEGHVQVEAKDSDIENGDYEDPTTSMSGESELALDTGRLFIRNLPYTTSEEDLLEIFSQFGDVSQVHLVVDKDSKRSKGIAFVQYTLSESAVRALEELDNSIFQGRLLHVMPAKAQNPFTEKIKSDLSGIQGKKNFKQRREEDRKASEASGNTRAWNSLFMRSDTIVENIARKHGISKSDVLDREADDLPVRIALGEVHVIAETKKALSVAGVNIAALEEHASRKTENIKRSDHVILVKNLPYVSSSEDLAKMFGKFGSLDKIILPPTKALGMVVFLEAAEARAAFKGLSYKRYKDAPLYLEWAPGNILSPETRSDKDEIKNVVSEQNVKSILLEQSVDGIDEEDIDPDRVESRSLFVKNLNFKTSDEALRKHFSDNMKKGSIKSVKVKTHLKNGKNVSMGFGFIEFDSVETSTDVCRDLQGTILDGHALILQICHAKTDDKILKKDGKNKSSTKLMVRNMAFEATEKDIRQLFSPFGQIKSLRLPKKLDGHRGFAFVEYVTKQEAQKALQALASTHLYGRHLVIERAKDGESLEEIRERTAAQFVDERSGFQKLSKKRKLMTAVDEGNAKFSRLID